MPDSGAGHPALELEGVHLRRAGRTVLRGVTLRLAAGSRTALLGPLRAGKTSLLHVIQGIERTQAGAARVAGCSTRRTLEVRRGIGYLPAEPTWYPHLTCLGVGEFLRGLYPNWDRERFVELLARLGVPPRQRAATLAPGVKARLGLAAALAHAPPLVLVDLSPQLDDVARERLLTGLDDELPEGAALLIASDRLAGLADRVDDVVILVGGEVRFAGAQADLLARLRRVEVAAAEPPELPKGVRSVSWRKRGAEFGELVVEVETPAQLVELEALPTARGLDLLDLEQAYLALAWPPAPSPRARPAPSPPVAPGQSPEGQSPEGQSPEGQSPEGPAPEGQSPEGPAPEGPAPDVQARQVAP